MVSELDFLISTSTKPSFFSHENVNIFHDFVMFFEEKNSERTGQELQVPRSWYFNGEGKQREKTPPNNYEGIGFGP